MGEHPHPVLRRDRRQSQLPEAPAEGGRVGRTASRVGGGGVLEHGDQRAEGRLAGGPRASLLGGLGWPRTGQQLQTDHADGVEVLGGVRVVAAQLLVRGVARGGEDQRRPGHPRLVDRYGGTEVAEQHVGPTGSGGLEQQVGRLHVAVHDAGRVDGLQALEDLVEELDHPAPRQRTGVADQVGDRATTHQRHREEHPVVVGSPGARGQDVRVLDAHRLLTHEPQHRARIGLAQQLGRPDLTEPVVTHGPDRPHAPLGDRIEELVASCEQLPHPLSLSAGTACRSPTCRDARSRAEGTHGHQRLS